MVTSGPAAVSLNRLHVHCEICSVLRDVGNNTCVFYGNQVQDRNHTSPQTHTQRSGCGTAVLSHFLLDRKLMEVRKSHTHLRALKHTPTCTETHCKICLTPCRRRNGSNLFPVLFLFPSYSHLSLSLFFSVCRWQTISNHFSSHTRVCVWETVIWLQLQVARGSTFCPAIWGFGVENKAMLNLNAPSSSGVWRVLLQLSCQLTHHITHTHSLNKHLVFNCSPTIL